MQNKEPAFEYQFKYHKVKTGVKHTFYKFHCFTVHFVSLSFIYTDVYTCF